MKKSIWIYAEHNDNKINDVTLQLITHVQAWQQDVNVVLFEKDNAHLEQDLRGYGAQQVMIYHYQNWLDDVQKANLLAQLVQTYQPNVFLFGADDEGKAVAPHLQGMLGLGLTADCIDIDYHDGQLIQYKPSYGDDVICQIIDIATPQMATVRSGMFDAVQQDDKMPLIKDIDNLPLPAGHMQLMTSQVMPAQPVVANAKRIVAIGRGASDPESVKLAKQLAKRLDAVLMTSRPVSLLAGFGQAHQIGLTGNTVRPELLLTLGVSGSTQFLAGVKNVHTLVSVNTDAKANIFNYADYKFVGDAKQFMQACLAKLNAKEER